MSFRKTFLVIAFLGIFVVPFLSSVPKAQAITAEGIRAQIAELQAQIQALQQKLAEIEEAPAVWCHDFHLNLKYGMGGTEVRALQTALEQEGFYARTISGSFDEYTGSAVVGFQQKYKQDVLTPWGLTYGTGYVGRTTRAKLNVLYGCGVVKPVEPVEPVELQQNCSDSDGGKNLYVKGTITGNYYPTLNADELTHGQGTGTTRSFTEYCRDSNTLIEFYCVKAGVPSPLSSGTEIVAVASHCSSGCENGACKREKQSISVVSPNGGEEWTYGKSYRIRWSQTGLDTDRLDILLVAYDHHKRKIGHDYVIDVEVPATNAYYLWIPSAKVIDDYFGYITLPAYFKVKVRQIAGKAGAEGIYDVSDDYFTIDLAPGTSAFCEDSDGGRDYFVKGTVNDDGKTYTDYCLTSITLKEYFCSKKTFTEHGEVAAEQYGCVYGCSNGVCKEGMTVTSPIAREQWSMGKTYDIKWRADDLDEVNIVLLDYRAGRSYYTIATNVSASLGRYSWTIPENVFPGGSHNFKIWIGEYKPPAESGDWEPLAATAESYYYDESDYYFGISGKYVRVNIPDRTETWIMGDTYYVSWFATGLDKVNIVLLDYRAGRSYLTIATDVSASPSTYSWTIPTEGFFPSATNPFKVWIGEYKPPAESGDWEPLADTAEASIYDESDSYFSIIESEKG